MGLKKNINNDIKSIITDIVENGEITQDELRDENILDTCMGIVLTTISNIYDNSVSISDIMISARKIFKEYTHDDVVYYSLVDRDEHTKELTEDEIQDISDQITYLKGQPHYKQRSVEWHEFRNSMITASDLAQAINMSKYGSPNKLILKKCGAYTGYINPNAIKHGTKYEDVAVMLYEKRNNVIIDEYGCIRHNKYSFIGASPDGICSPDSPNKNLVGRMLEIKCPKSRKITGIPPIVYAVQVQSQLEVCDLEYCDFLECNIKEYNSLDEYLMDDREDKGCVITTYNIEDEKENYIYSPIGIGEEELNKWKGDIENIVLSDENLDFVNTCFWKLEKYSCVLLKRSRKWFNEVLPKIEKFWNDVEFFRKHGHEELLEEIQKKKKNKKVRNYDSFGGDYAFLKDDTSPNITSKTSSKKKKVKTHKKKNASNSFDMGYAFLPYKNEDKKEDKKKHKKEHKKKKKKKKKNSSNINGTPKIIKLDF